MSNLKPQNTHSEVKRVDSEEILKAIIGNTSDLIFLIDSNYKFVFVNNSLAQDYGKSPEDFIGKTIQEMNEPKTAAQFSNHIMTVLKSGKRFVTEEKAQIQGKEVVISSIFSPVLDNYGKPVAVVGIIKDITKQRKVEETNRQLARIVESSDYAIIGKNIDGIITSWNLGAEKIYGYSPKEVLGKSISILTPPELHDEIPEILNKIRNGEKVERYQSKRVTKDGKLIDVSITVSPIIDDKGDIVGASTIAQDISQQKLVEEKLRHSDMIFEYSFDMFCIAGFDGYFKVLNPAWSKTLGWSIEELLDRPWIEFVHPEDRRATENAKASLVDGKLVFQFRNRYISKDGSVRWFSWTSVPISNEKLIFGVVRDETEKKKFEDELVAVNEKLRVIGKLTRHDIRNKLMVITTNTYLLKKKLAGNPELIKDLETIESACRFADRLFELGQFYERIGVEAQKEINIRECFDEAVALIENWGNFKVINKCLDFRVMADSLLRQAFYNLIDNSLKHGKKVSNIMLSCKAEDGATKLFYEDDGIGIPKASKDRIFTEGFTTGEGTGLGLPIIRKILQVYGWSITEEGEPSKGVKFVIKIPQY